MIVFTDIANNTHEISHICQIGNTLDLSSWNLRIADTWERRMGQMMAEWLADLGASREEQGP